MRLGRNCYSFLNRVHAFQPVLRSGGLVRGFASEGEATSQKEKIAFVSGGGRGLGLEYVRQLLQRPGQSVIAGVRNPNNAKDLHELKEENGDKLSIVQLDITDEGSIEEAINEVETRVDHLDLLINATGFLHDNETSPETALSRLTSVNLRKNWEINTMGPILVAKAFTPLLINAAKKNGASSENPAVIASMSARVGSIGDNDIGGWHSYRSSKAALNQLNKCMSIEFARKKHKIACILLHPGTVDTDLSKPFQKNVKPEKLFSKERAIKQLLEIIDGASLQDNGRFIAWDKAEIPW